MKFIFAVFTGLMYGVLMVLMLVADTEIDKIEYGVCAIVNLIICTSIINSANTDE